MEWLNEQIEDIKIAVVVSFFLTFCSIARAIDECKNKCFSCIPDASIPEKNKKI
tara:strand:- start:1667 stop:1828 length:162 start_codon:yes stop_codon:yes gene_type:complete